MTRVRVLGIAALFVVVTARCVLYNAVDLGDRCETSVDCDGAGLVCVLLDESQPGGERVCVPMRRIDEPAVCTAATDCAAAAYPVDATCVEGLCACAGDPFVFACEGFSVMDPLSCLCIAAVPACDGPDAGPDDGFDGGPCPIEDAGPEPDEPDAGE